MKKPAPDKTSVQLLLERTIALAKKSPDKAARILSAWMNHGAQRKPFKKAG